MLKILAACTALTLFAVAPAARGDSCISDNLKLKTPAARGRVVYVRKNGIEDPIPNASLELRQMKADEWVMVARTSSDGGGHFEFQAVSPGKYELFVSAPQMVNYGARLQVLRASGAKAGGKRLSSPWNFFSAGADMRA